MGPIKPDPYFPEFYSPHPAFSKEKTLRDFLVQNYQTIPGLKHLKVPKPEYRLPSGRKIDILFREKGTNAYVVVELKRQAGDPVGQIEHYMVEVDRKLAKTESPQPQVKGIIITGQPNSALERTLQYRISEYEVTWFLYRVGLELHERATTQPARGS